MKQMKVKTKNYIKKRFSQFKKLIINVWNILKKPEMAILPGQLAFFLILSVVPILTLIGYIMSYLNISLEFIFNTFQLNFDKSIIELITPIIDGKSLDLKLVIILIVMFFIASKGPDSIIVTANEINGTNQTTWIKRRIKALILTLILVILFLFIVIVPVLGKKIISAADFFNIKTILTSILAIIRGPFSWLIIFIFIKIIFSIAPDNKISSSKINMGAIFTTIGWVVSTNIYTYYVNNFAMYNIYYSSLSNIAVLMLWIYFLSYILVIGLSLTIEFNNQELAKIGSINENN